MLGFLGGSSACFPEKWRYNHCVLCRNEQNKNTGGICLLSDSLRIENLVRMQDEMANTTDCVRCLSVKYSFTEDFTLTVFFSV